MKYGLIPTTIPERLALLLGRVAIPVLDANISVLKARSLMAGVRLGVFEALRERQQSATELARRLSLDADCLELLLRVLVDAEYLVQRNDCYGLSKLGRRTLIAGAARELVGYVQWSYTIWEFAEHLEELLRTGKGVDFHAAMRDPTTWAYYQRGMLELARFQAPVLAGRVRVPRDAKRLLDLGGSHGLLGAAICRKHPPMRSTVIDLPPAIPHARELARLERIDDLVEHRAGDLLNGALPSGNDVVLVANVLHHFRPEQVRQVAASARSALRRAGTIAIWDLEPPPKDAPTSLTDVAALLFRLTSSASLHRGPDYATWLKEAGFRNVRVHRPTLAPGRVLVTGMQAGNGAES